MNDEMDMMRKEAGTVQSFRDELFIFSIVYAFISHTPFIIPQVT
jgi:hypothetical protein